MIKHLLLPLALILATPAAAQPPVWVVRDADSTIAIFGSVHLLPPGLDWRPPQLEAALKSADDLWFELPIDGAASMEAAQLALQKGVLPKGQTLSAKLSPQGRERLKAATEALHLDLRVIDRMQPWLAELTLGVAKMAGDGANGSDGVERTLAKDAPTTAERRAFETPSEQIALFAGIPEKDQIAALERSLGEMAADPKGYGKLVEAWMAGDLAALETGALEPMRKTSPVLYDRFVVERNARWTAAIAERLAGSGESVVVVGAAHLIGKDGVPAMLRARGLTVEGP